MCRRGSIICSIACSWVEGDGEQQQSRAAQSSAGRDRQSHTHTRLAHLPKTTHISSHVKALNLAPRFRASHVHPTPESQSAAESDSTRPG